MEKFSGNKRFDVDEKLGLNEFIKLIENSVENNKESEEEYLEKIELCQAGNSCFKDDPEYPFYKKMVQLIKEMKKPLGKK